MGRDITSQFRVNILKYQNLVKITNDGGAEKVAEIDTSFKQNLTDLTLLLLQLKNFIKSHSISIKDITNDAESLETLVNDSIVVCNQKINELKENNVKIPIQQKQHRDIICQSLNIFLKNLCKSYVDEQTKKAQNIMRQIELSKLQAKPKITHIFDANKSIKSNYNTLSSPKIIRKDDRSNISKAPMNQEYELSYQSNWDDEGENELSFGVADSQELATENERLYEEYTSSMTELQSIETRMVEISRLQDVLTENLITQEESVDRVAITTVSTTENIKMANTEIIKALQRKAGLRIWILFIIIVLTLTLLFIDWYNP